MAPQNVLKSNFDSLETPWAAFFGGSGVSDPLQALIPRESRVSDPLQDLISKEFWLSFHDCSSIFVNVFMLVQPST